MKKCSRSAVRGLGLVAALAASVGFASASRADIIYTFNGTTGGGNTVDATADFAFSPGVLTLTLTNLLVNQKDVGQNVSGLDFTLAGVTSITLASQNAPTNVTVVRRLNA